MIDSFGIVARIFALMLLSGVGALLVWWRMVGPALFILGAIICILLSIFSSFENVK